MSERHDGTMLMIGDQDGQSTRNRQEFFSRRGIKIECVVSAGLEHGNNIAEVGEAQAGLTVGHTDGLVTKERNLFLSITVADCAPLFFFDSVIGVVGLAHCGWRGVAVGLPKKMAEFMRSRFGCRPNDLLAAVGPCLQPCHFEIKSDVSTKFREYDSHIFLNGNKIFLDLPGVIKTQLVAAGLVSSQVESSGICTFCESKRYFSYRRDGQKPLPAMVLYIGLKHDS